MTTVSFIIIPPKTNLICIFLILSLLSVDILIQTLALLTLLILIQFYFLFVNQQLLWFSYCFSIAKSVLINIIWIWNEIIKGYYNYYYTLSVIKWEQWNLINPQELGIVNFCIQLNTQFWSRFSRQGQSHNIAINTLQIIKARIPRRTIWKTYLVVFEQ